MMFNAYICANRLLSVINRLEGLFMIGIPNSSTGPEAIYAILFS